MRLFTSLALTAAVWSPTVAFSTSSIASNRSYQVSSFNSSNDNAEVATASTSSTASTPCDIPSEFRNSPNSLVNIPNGANAIRSAVVTNYQGDFVRLDDAMGGSANNIPQIVCFLRHMVSCVDYVSFLQTLCIFLQHFCQLSANPLSSTLTIPGVTLLHKLRQTME